MNALLRRPCGLFLLATLLLTAWGTACATEGPRQLVEQTSSQVLGRLAAQHAEMKQHPERLYALVKDLVLPHFDFVRMSKWVLGRRYWSEASDAQKRRFVLAFRDLLVRTYATALLEYTDQKVKVQPLRDDPAQGDVVVRTDVEQSGGRPVSIDYSLYRNDSGAWKVYDVAVEGVSLLSSYRSSFASQIRREGMDALIKDLESRTGRAGA